MFHNKVSTKITPKTIFLFKIQNCRYVWCSSFFKGPKACKMVGVNVALLAFKACSKFDNDLGSTCCYQMAPIQVLDLIIHQILSFKFLSQLTHDLHP